MISMPAAICCSQETIENGYFWSNVVSLGLLGCLFIMHRLSAEVT